MVYLLSIFILNGNVVYCYCYKEYIYLLSYLEIIFHLMHCQVLYVVTNRFLNKEVKRGVKWVVYGVNAG